MMLDKLGMPGLGYLLLIVSFNMFEGQSNLVRLLGLTLLSKSWYAAKFPLLTASINNN